MNKILISWLAFNNDFKENPLEISPSSPNFSLHKYYYKDHTQHILLYTSFKELEKVKVLETAIKKYYPKHNVFLREIPISDIINVKEILSKTEGFLSLLDDVKMEAFISPGTPAMQTAWYLLAMQGAFNLKLIQGRDARYTQTKIPEFLSVEIEKSSTPISAIIKENSLSTSSTKYKIDYNSIKPIYDKALKIASAEKVTTLIRGDSGTGKENLAKFIHDNSARKENRFCPVNCSAIGDNLLESRLFGYVKGAFTGAANKDTKGLFEEADGGTIFLDEIGDISPNMQQSLLRVLQENEIMPVGSSSIKKVDVRIITATNKPLEKMCKNGQFRWDLYYRLNVTELELPSLLEWDRKDKEALIDNMFKEKAFKFQRDLLKLNGEAKQLMMTYQFPGNIRELENLVENFYVFCEKIVTFEDFPKRFKESNAENSLNWKDVEKKHIEYVLKLYKGNQRQTFLALGYGSINTLVKKIKYYGIVC